MRVAFISDSVFKMNTPGGILSGVLDDPIHVRLFAAAHLTLARDHWRAQNVLDRFWRLYVNDRDGAQLQWSGKTIPLQANTGYFIPARVPFSGHTRADITHFYVHFDVLGLAEGVRRELFAKPLEVATSPVFRDLTHAAVRALAPEVPGGALDFTQQIPIKALLYSSLAACIAAAPSDALQRARQLQQAYVPLAPALSYIDENLTAPLTISHLAGLCHFSDDYFIRRFRQSMGQSAVAYIQEKRVTLAAQRLLFSPDSIETIAAQCGFGNRFYFSRVFKKHTGFAPAAYRGATRL